LFYVLKNTDLLYLLMNCQMVNRSVLLCSFCGKPSSDNVPLFKCSGCLKVCYCSRLHQQQHWNDHKKHCDNMHSSLLLKCRQSKGSGFLSDPSNRMKFSTATTTITANTKICEQLNEQMPNSSKVVDHLISSDVCSMACGLCKEKTNSNTSYAKELLDSCGVIQGSSVSLSMNLVQMDNLAYRTKRLAHHVLCSLNHLGWTVVDDFLGYPHAAAVLNDVLNIYNSGRFVAGQISHKGSLSRQWRSDLIYWYSGVDDYLESIAFLLHQIDDLILSISPSLTDCRIDQKSKAMLSCYKVGSYYVKHVDNAERDGRLITCVYYMNQDWIAKLGGLLRIFPTNTKSQVDIEPLFDRLIIFWSDRRNPHEVTPTLSDRFAITVWYFDGLELECQNDAKAG
ncbi:Egl nine -like protein 1, partial [Trichinella sp. T6]